MPVIRRGEGPGLRGERVRKKNILSGGSGMRVGGGASGAGVHLPQVALLGLQPLLSPAVSRNFALPACDLGVLPLHVRSEWESINRSRLGRREAIAPATVERHFRPFPPARGEIKDASSSAFSALMSTLFLAGRHAATFCDLVKYKVYDVCSAAPKPP